MATALDYAEHVAELRHIVGHPARGIVLVEFATIPQLAEIVADLRALDVGRSIIEVPFDAARENAAQLLDRAQQELDTRPAAGLPLLILRPLDLPDAGADHPAAAAFWRNMNLRREAWGDLDAQIFLCVDPWHHQRLIDFAADLRTWAMPKLDLMPPPELPARRTEALSAVSAYSEFELSPKAAETLWEVSWPLFKLKHREGRLEEGDYRRYILPLLESALVRGNLVQAREVRDAASSISVPDEDKVRWHKLMGQLACAEADPVHAEQHAQKLLELAKNHPNESVRQAACVAVSRLGSLLGQFGQAEAAEDLFRDNIDVATALHGPEHPQTLASRNNLALALGAQGKHAEGEEEHRAELSICERVLGAEHPDTLTSRSNLANALDDQGKHAEAEREHRAVLALRERVLGDEHPDTLTSRNNLANALYAQGKHAEAEREYRAALAIRERVLGAEHPNVFHSCYNLALALGAQEKYREALDFARRAEQGSWKVLGVEHQYSKRAKALRELIEAKMIDENSENNGKE